MKVEDEERIAADLAKIMAMICIRNTRLEDLHAGVQPVTLTGDYSDVNVIDATGQTIPWRTVSHIDDAQMADLMRDIVNRLFTFHMRRDDLRFRDHLDRWMTASNKWYRRQAARVWFVPEVCPFVQWVFAGFVNSRAKTDSLCLSQARRRLSMPAAARTTWQIQEITMRTVKSFTTVAVALALALGSAGIAAAQSQGHDSHGAGAIEITLNDGAKWQGDQNMITGMTAIHGTMAANLTAIHNGTLPADVANGVAADVQKQVDFMVENCVLEPEVDEQFHIVLGEVMTGISALEAGEVETGAVTIVQALNAYGEHFEHPGWQNFN